MPARARRIVSGSSRWSGVSRTGNSGVQFAGTGVCSRYTSCGLSTPPSNRLRRAGDPLYGGLDGPREIGHLVAREHGLFEDIALLDAVEAVGQEQRMIEP